MEHGKRHGNWAYIRLFRGARNLRYLEGQRELVGRLVGIAGVITRSW